MPPSPFQSRTAARAPEHVSDASARLGARDGAPLVLLVGNPNCGKSTIFNALTGGDRAVGNWAGVTVDSGAGRLVHAGREFALIDLPGVYSLSAATLDEQVTRDAIGAGTATLLVNVLDASNLERNLYLTMQLAELGMPMVVVLNMGDTAADKGMTIDAGALAAELGCPVVEACAARRTGLEAIGATIAAAHANPAVPRPAPLLDPLLETEVAALADAVTASSTPDGAPPRWIATRLIEYDEALERTAAPAVLALRDDAALRIEEALDEECDILVADGRYERIAQLVDSCVQYRGRLGASRTERLDRIALHPRLGIPVFLGVMYVMFLLTITFGSAFIDLFDQLGGLLFVDLPAAVLHAVGLPEGLVVLLADGLGGGLQSVATFVPPVGIMFLCLRFLEESGYMARAAFVMDRFMRGLGLPGKAFVPMIVGFGCNVPAIMGARTLERERDRKLAVALNPFMSCGARLPVYALFAAAFFPSSGQTVVFALYLIGIAVAVMTGLILKRTVLQGELTPFVMELPPYHRPSLTSVLRGAWGRLKGFLIGAGKLIVPVVACLTLLGSMGTDGSFGHDNQDDSVLSAIGRGITPVFSPMGIEPDNWPATVGIFTGIFAKEAVVGSLDALYSKLDATGDTAPEADEPVDAAGAVGAAFATVPPNLADAVRSMVDPLGLSVGTIDDPQAAAEEQGVDAATYGAMTARFDGQVGAFAYLLFILLYLPCVAATAAIYRETGRNWAIFVGAWTTGLAFMAATLCYQVATFAEHPGSSAAWIVGLGVLFAVVVARMRAWSASDEQAPGASAPAITSVRPAPRPAPDAVAVPTAVASARHGEPLPTPVQVAPAPQSPPPPPPGWNPRPVFPAATRIARIPDRPAPARPAPVRPVTVRPAPVRPVPARTTPVTARSARLDGRAAPGFTRTFFTATAHGGRDE